MLKKYSPATKISFIIISIFIVVTQLSFSTMNEGLLQKIKSKLENITTSYPQEKIYIHFDKPYYSIGEDIWFKSYLVDGNSHQPTAFSKVIYVELIDPQNEIVQKKTIRVDKGGGNGEFHLGEKIAEGVYTVRAYTNFMRNFDNDFFFSKRIQIWNTNEALNSRELPVVAANSVVDNSDSMDLQFFPEGGDLVSGLLNYVGFKAIGSDGKGIDLKGVIEDSKGEKVMDFNSSKFGMGVFVIVPQPGESYVAKVDFNNDKMEFPMPVAKNKGIVMHVDDKGTEYHIRVLSNLSRGIDEILLIGQQRSQLFCNVNLGGNKNTAIAVVDKSLVKDGIAQFTLFSKEGVPLCERIVFVNEKDKSAPKLELSGLKKEYDKRELVDLEILLNDSSKLAIGSNLSISITDNEIIERNNSDNNIVSHLLLCSDIKGEIENPGYYFETQDKQRKKNMDILMMTQGWRRFIWTDILNDSVPTLSHLMENGLSITGKVSDFSNHNKAVKAKVSISSLKQTYINDEVESNKLGKFIFTGYDFSDSTELIIQAKPANGKRKNKSNGSFHISMEENTSPSFQSNYTNSSHYDSYTYSKKYLERSAEVFKIDSAYKFDNDVIVLKGVEVKAKRDITKNPFYRAEANYAKPDSRVILDSLPGAKTKMYVFDVLQGNVPGVVVSGSFPNHKVKVRGNNTINGTNEPLFVLNGMPTDFASIYNISPSEIHFIDVLKGASAAAYGIRGASGVIAVYTRDGMSATEQKTPKGIITYIHPGYTQSREFYHPSYEIKKREHIKPDYRTTLYWNPNLKLEGSEPLNLQFYTSDQSSEYRIEIEGITSSGIPIRHERFFGIR